MRRFSIIVLAAAACAAAAQEPVQTDGDKYKLVLENDCLRVLSYRDQPGEQTHQHAHPAFVVIAVEPFKRTITLPDGKVLTREFKAGDVMWSDAQTHVGRNVGSTPSHAILVELKKAGPGCSAR
ncbi:MAG: cytoplasmic protein [Burkholderiales bacterium]|nr:cytoplasmic protein [Burkholderiales bacterium]